MGLYKGNKKITPIIVEKQSESTNVQAYVPQPYYGNTDTGTKVILNPISYYNPVEGVVFNEDFEGQKTSKYYASSYRNYEFGREYTASTTLPTYIKYYNGSTYVSKTQTTHGRPLWAAVDMDYILSYKPTSLEPYYTEYKNYSFNERRYTIPSGANLYNTGIKAMNNTNQTVDKYRGCFMGFIADPNVKNRFFTIDRYASSSYPGYLTEFNFNEDQFITTYPTLQGSSSYTAVAMGLYSDDMNNFYDILIYSASGSLNFSSKHFNIENDTAEIVVTNRNLNIIPTGYGYYIQTPKAFNYTGSATGKTVFGFILTGENLGIIKFVGGDTYWEKDEQNATIIKEAIDFGVYKAWLFYPQVDGSVYIAIDGSTNEEPNLYGFKLNSEGVYEAVEHPILRFLPEVYTELATSVNIDAQSASAIYKDENGVRKVLYLSLEEQQDTGDLEWVLCENKKINYTNDSITGFINSVSSQDDVEIATVGATTK